MNKDRNIKRDVHNIWCAVLNYHDTAREINTSTPINEPIIFLKAGSTIIYEGEFCIVPKGIEHLPYADDEAHVLLFEPKQVLNTGNAVSEKTVENLEWL